MSDFEDWATGNPDEAIKSIREKMRNDDGKVELPKVILTPKQFEELQGMVSKPINDEFEKYSPNYPEEDSWPFGANGSELFIRRKKSPIKILITKPNHHGIALNSARVIEDFSKSLEKMKDEKIALIEWLKKSIKECETASSRPSIAGMISAYRTTLIIMGEDV